MKMKGFHEAKCTQHPSNPPRGGGTPGRTCTLLSTVTLHHVASAHPIVESLSGAMIHQFSFHLQNIYYITIYTT